MTDLTIVRACYIPTHLLLCDMKNAKVILLRRCGHSDFNENQSDHVIRLF